ncbi:aldehyde dehydrogenase family protein [Ruixingdingia sedimenti]|uniref:Aldehyde dehydrogenase family protein n=1 Tax=Ruixingdingia sedimenti TaxID=3073604 RepID=A0ABU1FEM5_9RHOB|nr:aldehyde dehydrogenase family protein [Xinfangfangia sp. LG-4]MDR5655353.1 aldehyde dehydrogenase family protein [Xinfangfangia sp. LG-4]
MTVIPRESDVHPEHPGMKAARAWLAGAPKRLLIDGEWVAARSGRTIAVLNPATEEELALIAEGDKADVDAAVAAARRALEAPNWKGISPHARTRVLLAIADAIERHKDELSALESLDNGMPSWFSAAALGACVDAFRYYAGWPSKIHGTTNPTDAAQFIYTLREPVGVCGQINPWNVPLLLVALKIAPPLACGNTVVLKPSELASLTSLRIAELAQETGLLPPGVLNIVTGYGPTVGAAMTEHPDIDKVSFTGSTAVGRSILLASAGNFKRVTLELGGKTPNIIFPDADMEKAVLAAVNGFTRNSGQICSAGSRLFVHESIHDEVAQEVSRIAATLKVGSPFEADTKLGPVISARQRERVMGYVDAGNADGANLMTGGCQLGNQGYYIAPTVFSGVKNRMKIAREEIFGPVLSIIPFKDEEDAVFQGNDTPYGLAAGIWTRDIGRAHKMARAIRAGRVWINTFGETDPVMPFGGFKQSGIGREFGIDSVMAYTETKSVHVRF